MTVATAYAEHIDELERRAIAGDDFAVKSLACMVLLKEGWKPGDPDPTDDDDPDGGERVFDDNVIDLMGRLAA